MSIVSLLKIIQDLKTIKNFKKHSWQLVEESTLHLFLLVCL